MVDYLYKDASFSFHLETKNLALLLLNLLGRFDRLLYVGPPSKKDREDIFRVHLNRMPCNSDVCINELSLLTGGYTGADISLICREAAIRAIEVCETQNIITILFSLLM